MAGRVVEQGMVQRQSRLKTSECSRFCTELFLLVANCNLTLYHRDACFPDTDKKFISCSIRSRTCISLPFHVSEQAGPPANGTGLPFGHEEGKTSVPTAREGAGVRITRSWALAYVGYSVLSNELASHNPMADASRLCSNLVTRCSFHA